MPKANGMKAEEVLRRYAAGERDFRRISLRGQSFKGKNLSGVDFSEADIRGAIFTNAYLKDSKFCGAKAGLQLYWTICLVIVSWILSGLSGILAGSTAYLASVVFDSNIANFFTGVVTIILIAVFFVIAIRKGLVAGLGSVAIAVALIVAGTLTVAMAGALAVAVTFTATVVVAGALAIAVTFAATVARFIAVVGALAIAVISTATVTQFITIIIEQAVPLPEPVTVAVAGTCTIAVMLFSAYLGWRAWAGDEQHAWIQKVAVACAATGGTSFRHADLTNADFCFATLKSTDFRGANLTRTCWQKDDPNQRRKPDNWDEEFDDGDFADFIKPIVDTLDLYHNQGVDPRAIAISLKQLAENNPEAELEIVAMEKRGKDKLRLRAATAPDADHSKLNAEYFKTYNQIKALAEAEVQALLAEKDSRISSLETMVETALQRPSFYTNTQVEQVDIMTNNPGGISQSNTGSMGGGQQGAIGDQNKQTMSTQAAASAGEQLTQQDVLQMLGQIEQMIDSAEIPEEIKEEANTYLGAAKKAVEKEEPNKERVNINLEGVAEQLDKASKVAEAGTTLFTKVKPILVKVAGWLGAAAGSFFGTL
jgi:hypothetical protein